MKKLTEKRNYIIALIIAIVCVVGFGVANTKMNYKKDNSAEGAKDYNELIINGTESEGEYVYVTCAKEPYLVAEYEGGTRKKDSYYVVVDPNDMMFVVKMSESKAIEVKKYLEEKDGNTYVLTGCIYKNDPDLEGIIIDSFKEAGMSQVSSATFDNYFGSTYLDASSSKYGKIGAAVSVIFFISIISTIVLAFFLIRIIVTTKKNLPADLKEELGMELNSETVSVFKHAKIYITERFFIMSRFGVYAARIQDIAWIYIIKGQIGGVKTSKLCVKLKDGREIVTEQTKDNEMVFKALTVLVEKNPNILVGYSYENMEAYNNIKKGN